MTEDDQLRALDERIELREKIEKLDARLNREEMFGARMEALERSLMRTQLVYMRGYLRVLDERIERFAWQPPGSQ